MKECIKCKVPKQDSDFYVYEKYVDKTCSSCRALECEKRYYDRYKNDENYKAKKKEWSKNNKGYYDKWLAENKEYIQEYKRNYSKNYYEENKERLKEVRKNWRKNNVEKTRILSKRGYEKKKALDENFSKNKSQNFRNTPLGLLTNRIHAMLKRFLKKKDDNSLNILGWNKQEFFERVGVPEKDFHIDHKVPVSWFDLETPLNIICSLDNLQLLYKTDNQSKSNLYSTPITKEYYNHIKDYIKEEFLQKITYNEY